MTGLPTRTEIFLEARTSLTAARAALSEVRDWLASDWQPTGTELTPRQADARHEIRRLIAQAKGLIDDAQQEAAAAMAETPTGRRPR